MPNICAEDMEIFPSASGAMSIFAVSLAALTISCPALSLIERSSMIILLSRPRSIRPIVTSVPSFSAIIIDTCVPSWLCMAGNCTSSISVAYRPITAHIIMLTICFSAFNFADVLTECQRRWHLLCAKLRIIYFFLEILCLFVMDINSILYYEFH